VLFSIEISTVESSSDVASPNGILVKRTVVGLPSFGQRPVTLWFLVRRSDETVSVLDLSDLTCINCVPEGTSSNDHMTFRFLVVVTGLVVILSFSFQTVSYSFSGDSTSLDTILLGTSKDSEAFGDGGITFEFLGLARSITIPNLLDSTG